MQITRNSNELTFKEIFQRFYSALASRLKGDTQKNGIAVLDSVRAIAILTVVFFHVSVKTNVKNITWLDPHIVAFIYAGNAGVTLFLVLSGFLLFLPYIKSLLFDKSWPSWRMFYLRRALRIIPAYYLSLFLLVILFQPVYLQPSHLKELFLFLTFFMDSTQHTFQKLNAPYWTLAVEWQYYMLLPWLALLIRMVVQRGSLTRRIWTLAFCLGIVMAWGITTRYLGIYVTAHPTITFNLPHKVFRVIVGLLYGSGGPGQHGKYLEDFGVGMMVAVIYTLSRNSLPESRGNVFMRWLSPIFVLGGILWLALMALWNAQMLIKPSGAAFSAWFYGKGYSTFHEFGLALGYGSFMMGILFNVGILKRIFEWPLLRWIGLISYSVYIWHNPVMLPFADNVTPFLQSWSTFAIFALVLTWTLFAAFPFSFVFYMLVEKPFMNFSDSLRKIQGSLRTQQIETVINEPTVTEAPAMAMNSATISTL